MAVCRNWMIGRWPFSTILLWILTNKQEFELYWCKFETALYPGIQGRGYKTEYLDCTVIGIVSI